MSTSITAVTGTAAGAARVLIDASEVLAELARLPPGCPWCGAEAAIVIEYAEQCLPAWQAVLTHDPRCTRRTAGPTLTLVSPSTPDTPERIER